MSSNKKFELNRYDLYALISIILLATIIAMGVLSVYILGVGVGTVSEQIDVESKRVINEERINHEKILNNITRIGVNHFQQFQNDAFNSIVGQSENNTLCITQKPTERDIK